MDNKEISSFIDDNDLKTKLDELLHWFEGNPNLPQKVERIVLLRFLKCMQYDMSKTKTLIELNYSIRNKNPNLFIDRNMEDEMTAKGLKVSDIVILPGLTPERYKVLFFRMVDFDPSTRNSVEETKIFFMMADARFTMPDVEKTEKELAAGNLSDSDIAEGDVQVVDIKGYTMRHLAYVSIFVLRVYMRFLQEAYPSRLRALHIINCPSFIDRMLTVMRPFIREEVHKMIKYHTEGLESLYEDVPKDMLPEEYGGKAGTMAELKTKWLRTLKEKSAYLRDEKYWRNQSQGRSRWSWF
ncbi:alpha-tocopherol transfer protein-like isoform X1 [Drosophila tropicalis]|uniref:alpha-tocopherol transfer protein-like isoform X1 n=1 Tax=Drosophila tropicalis TaxID=46794 RepID=UPI0035ABD69C